MRLCYHCYDYESSTSEGLQDRQLTAANMGIDLEHLCTVKLEGNCDLSSNNNVWTKFYEIFVGNFYVCSVNFIA